MIHKFKNRDRSCRIVKADAFKLFEDAQFVSESFKLCSSSNRSFPRLHQIYDKTWSRMNNDPNYKDLIRERLLEIVVRGQAVKLPEDFPSDPASLALDALHRCSFLQSELSPTDGGNNEGDVVYVFPSILHKR